MAPNHRDGAAAVRFAVSGQIGCAVTIPRCATEPSPDHDCPRVLTALRGMLLRVAVSRQTLCYVFRSGDGGRRQVLLGRKKRGFGAGMIMGLGGKAGPGESEAACAVREAGEEAGIAVDPGSLEWRAELSFVFPGRPELDAVVTVFFGREWAGEPRESEEMAPGWFDAASLQLDQMWDDEAYWLPRVMAGEALSGVITYDDACEMVARAELKAVGPQAGTGKAG